MNYDSYLTFVDLYEKIDNFEVAEQFINNHLQFIMQIEDQQLAQDCLTFMSEITGEHEGLERLSLLIDHFQTKRLITKQQGVEFIQLSPCNRWL